MAAGSAARIRLVPVKLEPSITSAAELPPKTALAVHALQVVQEADERVKLSQEALREAAVRNTSGTLELRMQAHSMALEAQRAANTHLQECLVLDEASKEEPSEDASDHCLDALVDVPDWKLQPCPDHFIPAPRKSCKAEVSASKPVPHAGWVRRAHRKPRLKSFTSTQQHICKKEPFTQGSDSPATRRSLADGVIPAQRKTELPSSWRGSAGGRLADRFPLGLRPTCKPELPEVSTTWRPATGDDKFSHEEVEDMERPTKYRKSSYGRLEQERLTAQQVKILRRAQTCCDWDPSRYSPEGVMSKWGHLLQFLLPEDLCFCHSQISWQFRSPPHCGQPLSRLLEDLLSEKVFPLDITPLVGVEDEGKIWVVCGNRRLYVLRQYSQKVRHANGEVFIPIYVHKKSSSDPLPASLFAKYVEASSTRTGGGWPSFFSNRGPWDCKKTDHNASWRT
ncbi:hypothetical protein AK812_SmicGene1029 [Symbiodinium microadriaticum]|uniref:Uncharacterized protein n=1 Tax=Symbiodinium microadriaticum TaxID=2951 RepID=A0A1Q9F5G4_SYMMI|nr:hypothetical protein AK812_SmicGene1029 [Symbiodinium microadriaticum]CAE7195370.1 unnamed protein product [Symbiodinium microadriaticum]CAE7293548.1 unnamed protein product [Symbiodinium sp. KB8]